MAGSTDAMSYVVDTLSGTTSGPELPPGPAETWQHQRRIINRYFQQLGWPELRGINVNQKVWCDRPYGREKDFFGEEREHKNLLSTEAIARLLHSIVGGVSVSSGRSQTMMSLLQSTQFAIQSTAFAQPTDDGAIKTWSIAGDRRLVSYAASYIEAPSTHPYQLIIFVEGKSSEQNKSVAAFVSQQVLNTAQDLFEQTAHS